jgi:hypothetical protein
MGREWHWRQEQLGNGYDEVHQARRDEEASKQALMVEYVTVCFV